MIKRFSPLIVVVLLLPAYLYSLSTVGLQRKVLLSQAVEVSYVLPSPLLKITSLEFDGVASDFLFLKVLTFYGGTFNRKERPRIKEGEWRWINEMLSTATDLDPWFYDPYYFGNANLTWDAKMPKEANTLLEKGNRYRDWDWTIPFFLGFNEFYFLHNNARATEYFMQGAKRPDAEPILSTLAIRLAYKANRNEIAMIFLLETLDKTKDAVMRRVLEMRMKTLQGLLVLEKAIDRYKAEFGKQPAALDELLQRGVLDKIPAEPSGGAYYIDKDGSVKTTSDMR